MTKPQTQRLVPPDRAPRFEPKAPEYQRMPFRKPFAMARTWLRFAGTAAPTVLFASALLTPHAWAWGPHGHRIATRIAEERLTPEARRAVRELLHEGDRLVDVANWADDEGRDAVPNSAPWHYVNVPITAARYDPRDCAGGACVVEKIKHYRQVLANRRAPRTERARALLFFVHFVEDIHQPLHVGDNHDRGGTRTQVQFQREGTNLHRLWDSGILNAVSRDERVWVERIEPLLTAENQREWSRGTVEDWANESLHHAQAAYRYPEGAADPIRSGTTIGKDYVNFARPIIERRLAQAGVRLANELNAVLR